MQQSGSIPNPIDLTSSDSPKQKKSPVDRDLSTRLRAQSDHNDILHNSFKKQIPYSSFPPNHPGHLTLQNQARLYNMVRGTEYESTIYRLGLTTIAIYYSETRATRVFSSKTLIKIAVEGENRGY